MTLPATSVCLLQTLIPELRNPRYRRTYFEARSCCLRRALAGVLHDGHQGQLHGRSDY
ncbi:hypothetical protein [Yersinia pseudotuberculosis]|uniref:hypothetical protein n=1 Tax=Yersinia pseudotuberculosis TaxID=633 RepID=UPI000F6D88D9|nr:hypothetical protein [Yersinia pseudotuberculosis]VEE73065.1 Uncharacterised protein [Yersinia pseudotuberculosis]